MHETDSIAWQLENHLGEQETQIYSVCCEQIVEPGSSIDKNVLFNPNQIFSDFSDLPKFPPKNLFWFDSNQTFFSRIANKQKNQPFAPL